MNLKNPLKASRILKKIWLRKKKIDPKQLSLRKLASKNKISPGYLSKVFSGEKVLSKDLAYKICKILNVDDASYALIQELYENTQHQQQSKNFELPNLETFELMPESSEWLLSHWYRLTILDLMTTVNFKNDIEWIAKKIDISKNEVELSLKYFLDSQLAEINENGQWRKKHLNLRFPTTTTKSVIRQHHKSQLKRAIKELDSKTTPSDFSNRLITSISIASNPEQMKAAKDYLHLALYKAAEILGKGPCTEVYQLNLQLFPSTKSQIESK